MKSLLLVVALSTTLFADNPNRNFDVTFTGCKEYVAFGPVSFATIQALLPDGFTATPPSNPFGYGLVVRTSACQGISVSGSNPRPGIVAHYGINIVAPDGTGDINNYTLLYATSSEALADRLSKTGMPVHYNRNLTVEDPTTRPGQVYIAISEEDMFPYFITGSVSDPAGPSFPFLANWWYTSRTGRVKMSTDIPAIAFGQAGLVVRTASASPLGKIIGGNSDSNFPFYNVRGVFASGRMTVTTTR